MPAIRRFLQTVHFILLGFGITAIIGGMMFVLLAVGVPGRFLQQILDRHLPPTVGQVRIQHVAYRPGSGLLIDGFSFNNPKGKCLAAFSRGRFAFTLFSLSPIAERLTAIELEDLFVAQIEYPPNRITESEPPPESERRPFPDLSQVVIPYFRNVALCLIRPNVLEVRANQITGQLSTENQILRFHDLKGIIDEDGQLAEADLSVDIHGGTISASIRGFIFQTRLNGIWRALDFPIIETYSNKFKLNKPAWADCDFTVGLDKYRNIFHLKVDIVSSAGGTYCGVPFDAAEGTIRCSGIWDAVTIIDPIIAKRNGRVIASGALRLDCPNNRFSFRASGSGLQPDECFRLIDLPFTKVIPEIRGIVPPEITIEGSLPLLTEQTPAGVHLKGHVLLSQGGTFQGIPTTRAEGSLSMANGRFQLDHLSLSFPKDGSLSGTLMLDIPESAAYTDLSADLSVDSIALSLLSTPFTFEVLPECSVSGTLLLRCRTDNTLKQSLSAIYDVTLGGGLITRVPLFSGLTDLIAEHIPGVSALTDSSSAHLTGTAQGGLFTIPHFSLTGDLLSIDGNIAYNLPDDTLSARLTAGNFKQGSIIGTLTRWMTLPVNRFLWEIVVSGSLTNPDWHLVTFAEKLWDKALGRESDSSSSVTHPTAP